LRPLTLNALVQLLKNPIVVDDGRSIEIASTLIKMGLLSHDKDGFKLTDDGLEFLRSVEEGRGDILHEFLLRLPEYRSVAETYFRGITTIKGIVKETGLNAVVVDVSLRLLNEVLLLSLSKQRVAYEMFVEKLEEFYKELTRKVRSKYVPLVKLRHRICSELGLNSQVFEELLSKFVVKNRERVILAPAPVFSKESSKFVVIGGRKYAYIYLRDEK